MVKSAMLRDRGDDIGANWLSERNLRWPGSQLPDDRGRDYAGIPVDRSS